jgi:hypothetical protein
MKSMGIPMTRDPFTVRRTVGAAILGLSVLLASAGPVAAVGGQIEWSNTCGMYVDNFGRNVAATSDGAAFLTDEIMGTDYAPADSNYTHQAFVFRLTEDDAVAAPSLPADSRGLGAVRPPNPFTGSTVSHLAAPPSVPVRVEVHDTTGRG